ncbi:hypothetical protein ILYODFUR_034128 [Ilyodon furcidens]|uniref:Uncharacterized protein n=1 Tax=Ilyodon furcidens TaxID=33524 RepID=A0ABV0TTB0_9TELE
MGGACKTMLCFIAEEDASGVFSPPELFLQFTFGPACNGLLQFLQKPGYILRKVSSMAEKESESPGKLKTLL